MSGSSATIAAGAVIGALSSQVTATCAAGKVVLGGGAEVVSSGLMVGAVASSYPSSTTAWTAQAVVISTGITGSITVTPWVLCSQ